MPKKCTHEGYVVGNDARTPKGYRFKVRLRETKLHWVTENHGHKYSKKDGNPVPRSDWPLCSLELSSIKELP